MKLYSSPTSPFARKVRMAALLCGLDTKIEIINTDVYSPPANYFKINPLIKIPAFEMTDGSVLINSAFICEYLDSISLAYKILPQNSDRWAILNDQAVADGAMDAAVLRRYESQRDPKHFDPKFDLRQRDKIINSLQYFEERTATFAQKWTLREITVACLIGYLQFRFAHEKLDLEFPKIFSWYQQSLQKFDFVKNTVPA